MPAAASPAPMRMNQTDFLASRKRKAVKIDGVLPRAPPGSDMPRIGSRRVRKASTATSRAGTPRA